MGTILPVLLLIDDDESMAKFVENAISDLVSFSWVNTLAKAESYLEARRFDLILLDLRLDEDNGLKGLATMREKSLLGNDTRVILLTASEEEGEWVEANKANIDEIVQKPVGRSLLRSIVQKYLRSILKSQRGELCIGRLRLVLSGQTLFYETDKELKKVNLSHSEFKILLSLAQAPGIVFTRDQLLDALGDMGTKGERVIDVHINSLRTKHPYLRLILKTQRGGGYFLDHSAE